MRAQVGRPRGTEDLGGHFVTTMLAVVVLGGLFPHSWGAVTFPEPTIGLQKLSLTAEQQWMEEHWPGYHNGVNLGGHLVMENWMFMRSEPPFSDAHIQLDYSQIPKFNNNMWSAALREKAAGNLRGQSSDLAFETLWCHMDKYYTDSMLDEFAEFGINSVRVPLGYWIFDDPELFPGDEWPVPLTTGSRPYGVNPEGFATPGTLALSNIIAKLWNRNMKVMLDMHALPGCSSPYQSYAGIECGAKAPNFWGGLAEEGISQAEGDDRHPTTRAKDGKTWADVYEKLAKEPFWHVLLKCVSHSVSKSFPMFPVHFIQQGAIPLRSGGWPSKRPLGRAANVPAELLHKLFSFRFASHGGFHAIPLNLPFLSAKYSVKC